MDVEVNYLGVLLAALSSLVVGSIWYSQSTWTGKEWLRLTKNNAKVQRSVNKSIGLAFAMSLILAYVIAHISYLSFKFYGGSFLSDALYTAFWLWLGVAFSLTVTHDSFEGRRYKLTAINTANMLATMLAMGLIIGLLGH